MIKKFEEYIKESNGKYENIPINVHEYNALIDERWIQIRAAEIEEIEKHINKYSPKYRIEIEIRNRNPRASYLVVSISNQRRYISFSICKLTDEWFTINAATISHQNNLYYKCDEMQGLLNQIDELIEKNIVN